MSRKLSTEASTNIVFDPIRANEYLAQKQARLLEIETFITSKLAILEAAKDKLHLFVGSANGTDLEIGNMYSNGFPNQDYKAGCEMLATGKLTLRTQAKNTKLAAKNLAQKWLAIFGQESITANFTDYQIKGNIVEFRMWI